MARRHNPAQAPAASAPPAKESTVFKRLDAQRLLALFVGGALLLNFPLLALWNRGLTVWGVPLFVVALFALWGLLIAALGWLVERMPE